jgi:hypothetical protein
MQTPILYEPQNTDTLNIAKRLAQIFFKGFLLF